MTFSADIIAGFPTENEEMFQNTINIVEECQLDWIHAFPFSPRPGTPAAKMPQNDIKIIKRRSKILREVAKKREKQRKTEEIFFVAAPYLPVHNFNSKGA